MAPVIRRHKMLQKLILGVVLSFSALASNVCDGSMAFEVRRSRRPPLAVTQNRSRATAGFDGNYKLSLPRPVQDKNFYLLSLFQRTPGVRKLLNRNNELKQLTHNELAASRKAAGCDKAGCYTNLMTFDDSTIEAVAAILQRLANRPEFKRLIQKDMRPAGVFIKYQPQTDARMLVAAWKDAANGINRIMSVYCAGKDPRYKEIDKVSFDVSSAEYRQLLHRSISEIQLSNTSLFFEPALKFALKLLEINRRDEAGRYEPLERGENRAAVENLRNINWSDYPYSFILVLGSGPSDASALSPIGAKRTDVAAQLFLQHKAPLIIVSGGHVHPMQTPYCEAIEMKKYLIDTYKIPEASILVEPQARHTTTNFRNAARLAFRYRLPADKTALVTSSESHIVSSVSEEFRDRCLNELGYFPIEFIKRISPVAAEFKPSVSSLFFDANDPLDP